MTTILLSYLVWCLMTAVLAIWIKRRWKNFEREVDEHNNLERMVSDYTGKIPFYREKVFREFIKNL